MPYIKPEDRRIATFNSPRNSGELNWALTHLLTTYVERHGLKYQIINDVIGALEGAKAEFYRRVAAPYENTKIQENGDVYPPEIRR